MCPHDRYVYLSSLYSEPQTDQDKAKIGKFEDIFIKKSTGKYPILLT